MCEITDFLFTFAFFVNCIWLICAFLHIKYDTLLLHGSFFKLNSQILFGEIRAIQIVGVSICDPGMPEVLALLVFPKILSLTLLYSVIGWFIDFFWVPILVHLVVLNLQVLTDVLCGVHSPARLLPKHKEEPQILIIVLVARLLVQVNCECVWSYVLMIWVQNSESQKWTVI